MSSLVGKDIELDAVDRQFEQYLTAGSVCILPLRCDLGCCSITVVVINAAAKSRLSRRRGAPRYLRFLPFRFLSLPPDYLIFFSRSPSPAPSRSISRSPSLSDTRQLAEATITGPPITAGGGACNRQQCLALRGAQTGADGAIVAGGGWEGVMKRERIV